MKLLLCDHLIVSIIMLLVISIAASSLRRIEVISTWHDVRSLTLINQGILPSYLEEEIRPLLLESATNLYDTQAELTFHNIDPTSGTYGILINPDIEVKELQGDRQTITTRNLNIINTVNQLTSSSLMIHKMNLEDITPDNSLVFFVTENARAQVLQRLNTSTGSYVAKSKDGAKAVKLLQQVLLSVSLGTMLLMILFVFRPTIANVNATKKVILKMFVGMF